MTEREVENREPLEWTDEPAPRARPLMTDTPRKPLELEQDEECWFTTGGLFVIQYDEPEWDEKSGGWEEREHMVFSLHYDDFDGPRLGEPSTSIDELKALAQRIENVLDPPECEHDHLAILLESGCEFNHCPFCGQLLEGSKSE